VPKQQKSVLPKKKREKEKEHHISRNAQHKNDKNHGGNAKQCFGSRPNKLRDENIVQMTGAYVKWHPKFFGWSMRVKTE